MILPTPQRGRRHGDFSGRGIIAGRPPGLVTVGGLPGSRRVEVRDRATGVLVARTWSRPDGTYLFTDLDESRRYYVVAFDHQLVYNAAIRDNIKPALPD